MAPGACYNEEVQQKKATDWDYLFSNEIPFKSTILLLLYHLPGFVAAVMIGLAFNVILEEILGRISRKLSESTYVTFAWIVLVVYIVFFTPFDRWVADQIHWYRIVPRPR